MGNIPLYFISAMLVFGIFPAYALIGCNPGSEECVDSTHYKVCGEHAVWGPPIACDQGTECIDGTCQIKLGCNPGERECIDSSSYRVCGSHAIWDPEQSCASWQACTAGYCKPDQQQCTQYQQTRCSPDSSNMIQICNSQYQWENWKTCDYGCNGGYCRACRSGMARCYDSYSYQSCDGDGQWGGTARCQQNYICDGGSCVVSPLLQCQSIGALRCSPDNSNILQQCSPSYQWRDFSACQLGCFSSACRVCSTGDSKCTDSYTYARCTSSGQWGGQTSCPNGYFCFSGSCQVAQGSQCSKMGDKRCSPDNSNMVQACSVNYVYTDYLPCSEGCINGVCSECKPGTSVCSGPTTYRTCTNFGQLSNDQNCVSGYTCDSGQCVATPQCTDGQRNCVSDTIYTCEGGQWKMLYICPSNTDCKESSGTAYCASAENRQAQPANQSSSQQQGQKQGQEGITPLEMLLGAIALVFAGAAFYLWQKQGKR